jgi:putative transposase
VADEFTGNAWRSTWPPGSAWGRVIEVLARLVSLHGAHRYIRSDNGRELVATAILRWLAAAQIKTAFIDPGKPWQNGTDESFNGKFRNECLTLEWFRNQLEAQVAIERWRRHYNDERPHMNLGNQTAAEYKAQIKKRLFRDKPLRPPFSNDRWSEETGQITTGAAPRGISLKRFVRGCRELSDQRSC